MVLKKKKKKNNTITTRKKTSYLYKSILIIVCKSSFSISSYGFSSIMYYFEHNYTHVYNSRNFFFLKIAFEVFFYIYILHTSK